MERAAYVWTFGVVTTLVLLIVFQIAQRLLSPAHTVKQDVERGNAARGLLQVGHVLGVFLISASVVSNSVEAESLGRDALWVAAFGGLSLILLGVTGHLGVKMLLKHRLPQEIERGNVAAGVAAGAHYVATGIITARAVAGADVKSLGLSLTFFAIAQLTLHLFVVLFRAVTAYDDAEQIQGENLAAALSYAGITIAVALIVGRAVEGDFVSWGVSLAAYGMALLFNFALYPVRQIVVQTIILGAGFSLYRGRLDTGIAQDRNVGMGALEAIAYIATALVVTRLG